MRVRVRIPASSANLGPGFDALALALALHNEVYIEDGDRVAVTVEGEGAGRLDAGARNIVARGARTAFEAAGRPFRGATIRCLNRIPLSRGLGSSAAAWVGGLVGANALLGEPLDRDTILNLAAKAEGHPDNVAAALLGGLTVSCMVGERVIAVSLPAPAELRWVLLVPDTEASTREARAVLPESVPRADAVFNVQRVSLLLAALAGGRPDLLEPAMSDRLHQPYRQRLFPWLEKVTKAARDAGALGSALSGAGPSVLAVARDTPDRVTRAMEDALRSFGASGKAITLDVDTQGARWEKTD